MCRDTLEQIDIAKLLVEKFSKTFSLVKDSASWKRLMRRGKIVGMLGVEGCVLSSLPLTPPNTHWIRGHQIGSSLSLLRVYYELGARYVTLTHTCHNALADSCGQGVDSDVAMRWNGLSDFGRKAVREMNRLGLASLFPLSLTPLAHSTRPEFDEDETDGRHLTYAP